MTERRTEYVTGNEALNLEGRLALTLDASGLHGYKREWRFHPYRRWKFDFAYLPERIAIEVEGGIWANGRHTRGSGFTKDCEKYNTAAILGWKVLRVTADMIDDGSAVQQVREALENQFAWRGLGEREE